MDKDIRFTEKKVDESWKDDITRNQAKQATEAATSAQKPQEKKTVKTSPESQKKFINFLMNIAAQALYLMQGGESGVEKDLENAEEMIAILRLLQERSQGNLSPEEERAFQKILYDLQMQFIEASKPTAPPKP